MSVLERVRQVEGRRPEETRARSVSAERKAQLKHDLVERLGLANVASVVSSNGIDDARAELEVTCEAILNTEGYDGLQASERASLVRQVLDEVCGLGPIQPLLEDRSITEIMVNGCGSLFFERGG